MAGACASAGASPRTHPHRCSSNSSGRSSEVIICSICEYVPCRAGQYRAGRIWRFLSFTAHLFRTFWGGWREKMLPHRYVCVCLSVSSPWYSHSLTSANGCVSMSLALGHTGPNFHNIAGACRVRDCVCVQPQISLHQIVRMRAHS